MGVTHPSVIKVGRRLTGRVCASIAAGPAFVVDDDGGALLAAALTAEPRLQSADREVTAARDQVPRIELVGMAPAPAQHPQEPPSLHGMPNRLDRPDPMPHHENN